jgi:mono/diheme cytochrome c family protein
MKVLAFFASRVASFGLGITLGAVLLAKTSALAESPPPVRFNRDIRPIMSDNCFACHGPGTREAGLRLDVRDETVQPADSGETPIVPGKPDESEVVRRVMSDDPDTVMPPPQAHKTLSSEQKEIIRRWVEQGAAYENHWSFEPPVKAEPPPVVGTSFPIHHPIDAFIADRLRSEGLTMSPEADRETLIRRVALALTGLPPTPSEVDTFLDDTSPDAYDKMVDRYLASERFGEEMARHWLDVARYADTHGLHLDNERQMWAYRDWVIRAFNQNKPFDQFTIDQLAGDLLPDASLDQLTATGFIRCNVTTGEGGSIEPEWVYRNAVDRATTTAGAWMGLTAGCCVCHDHKYDPLSIKDFYSLYAFFHSAADPPLDGNALLTPPSLKLATPEDKQKLAEFDTQITAKQKQLDELVASLDYTDPATVQPPPTAEVLEQFWFDDEFPSGSRVSASPGHPTTFVTVESGQVLGGQKALKRIDKGLAQDVIEGAPPLEIPPAGRLFAHVWIDPDDPPRTLMLQYFQGGWLHRAVWGDYDAIDWGARNTTERVLIGPLPELGQWARLEVEATRLGLKPGDQVTGFALTQFGGTVFWDQVGVAGRSDPAADPRRSLLAWWKQQTGKDTPGAPPELNQVLKAGPDEKRPSENLERKLRDYYLQNVCLDTKPQLETPAQELAAFKRQRDEFDKSIPSTFIATWASPGRASSCCAASTTRRGTTSSPMCPMCYRR